MNKRNVNTIVFSILSIALIAVIVFRADLVDTSKANDDRKESFVGNEDLLLAVKEQERQYLKDIDEITQRYQSLLDTLDSKLLEAGLGTEKKLLSEQDAVLIEDLKKRTEEVVVPVGYKKYHLLLSRSLLLLSTYLKSSDPGDIAEGLEVFTEAKIEFENLDNI